VVVGGSSGTVAELNLFFTNLDTPDGRRIIVPNNEVFGKTIENNTFHETRRCDVVVGVGYDDNIAEARQILIDAISSIEGVLEDPAPAAKLTELGASSVDFSVRAHCKTEDYYSVREKMLEQIKKACDEHGLDLPYPHQVVIHQDAAA
jgi:small conductance mechanosensitive channel